MILWGRKGEPKIMQLKQEDVEKVKRYIEAAREKGQPIQTLGLEAAMLERGIGVNTTRRIMAYLGYKIDNT